MTSLPRRRFLLSAAALSAAAAATIAPALTATAANHTTSTEATVRWNSSAGRWAPRPAHAPYGVVFLSSNDPEATPPTDPNLQAGDVWKRHLDAVAA